MLESPEEYQSMDSFEEEHLREYLDQVANILGISKPEYRVTLGSNKGDNFISVIYRVFIEGEKNGVKMKTQTIFKVPPNYESGRKESNVQCYFPRENFFYTEIVPIFKDLLKANNKKLENVVELHFSSIVDHKEAFAFEDLQLKGFVMRYRMKQMDFAHISLAFRALGRFHALSFALRDQKPDIFNSKIAILEEIAFRSENAENSWIINSYQILGNAVNTILAAEDPIYTERFSQYFKDFFSHTERACDGSIAEPYAVLCHGDFWMNNMMFKYEKESGEPRDIYMLDFQFARYASPAVDISFALFSSCSQELREKHFDELIKIYHESLSAYLVELGSDPKKLFPFEALLDQLDNFSIYSATSAMLAIPLLVGEDQNASNIICDNCYLGEIDEKLRKDKFLKNTLRDTYKDLIDRNFI